ncbi:MAG: hypothetical protein QXS20_09705 [Candidatus Thorarchaeota archaeon]
MTIARTAAVKNIIPAGSKVKELRGNLNRLLAELPILMSERFGNAGLDAVSEIFRRLGTRDAEAMKSRLGLGSGLRDALDAWLIIGNLLGSKIDVHWISDERVETEHPYCPQHEEFVKRGKIYCDSVCIPYVSAIASGIAPNVSTEVVRNADETHTCVKALVLHGHET